MKVKTNFLFYCFLIVTSSLSIQAQTVSITPKNVAPFGIISTGNTVAGKCDGSSKNYIKINIQPSCYGANLRGGGNVLDPGQGNVIMDLSITNKGSTFTTSVDFPNKITWPENYGQTCVWDSNYANGKVDCDMGSIKVGYTCNLVSTGWFLNDYLSCTRIDDPNTDGNLNLAVKCSFLYSWAGTGYAAVNSYSRISGVANCGLQDKSVDLANQITVNSSVTPANISKYAKRGKVTIDYNGLPIKKLDVIKNSATGAYEFSGDRSTISTQFYQMKGGVKYPLTQKVEAGFDEFEECLDVKAAFLGQNQFCGSFYSPLMVFFDQKRPVFAGRSSFPLVEGVSIVAWPEKKSSGYFLALDITGKKKIINRNQLFGDGNGMANGFEALKTLDSNHDGVIDEKDEKFKFLVLWNDKNSNGVSEGDEIFTLADKKIKSISLNYKDDRRKSFGRNAEGRQYSTFVFGDKNQTGEVVDIWFAPFGTDKEISKKNKK